MKTTLKLVTVLTLTTTLTACGFGGGNGVDGDAVRAGPQLVHPSGSALSQNAPLSSCGETGQPACG